MAAQNRALRRVLKTVVLSIIAQAMLSIPAVATDILAHVNGETVTMEDLDTLLETQKRPANGDPSHLTAEGIVTRLVQNKLLEQEGYRTEVQKSPEIRNQVWDLVRHRGMMALLDSISAAAPKPDADSLTALFSTTNVIYRLSVIVVDTEEAALSLRDSLAAGGDFAGLAARHSRDTTWTGEGGDLGWAKREALIPEFAAALENLSVGEVSGPIRTSQGWHLIRLTDSRNETLGQSDKMSAALRKAAAKSAVRQAQRAFIDSLKKKYSVAVNETLLTSLDYASADPEVQSALRSREDVLVELPWRNLTVKELTRIIRFEHFHGLKDKPDADAIRDKSFDSWLNEVLLRHEASVLGFDKKKHIVEQADRLERRLVREHLLEQIVDIPFTPSREELEVYYRDHQLLFEEKPTVRVSGVLLPDEPAARRFRRHLDDGARMGWLASRTPEVIDAEPEALSGWIEADKLGLSVTEAVQGRVLGPLPMGEAWAVAEVVEASPPGVKPFDECVRDVAAAMKRDRVKSAVDEALTLLESQADVVVAENANELITDRINAWLGVPVLGGGAASGVATESAR